MDRTQQLEAQSDDHRVVKYGGGTQLGAQKCIGGDGKLLLNIYEAFVEVLAVVGGSIFFLAVHSLWQCRPHRNISYFFLETGQGFIMKFLIGHNTK